MAGAVVGIDLGTTNTVVATVRGGKALVLADDVGARLLPSVVSFHPNGQTLVGHAARERRLVDAKNTVYSIKRLIGRAWGSDEVERARKRFPFELREGPSHGPLVVARGETYTLPEISAFVLKTAKNIAEKSLGESVERAVVTVPASFNDLQRAATKVAAREAGVEVLRILNEPTAAALAYGFGKSGNERIAVYDLGGGTFDLTLLDLSGNVFEVIGTAGDSFLGGDDIDMLIADAMANQVLREFRYDVRADTQAMERLRVAAEHVKMGLSSEAKVGLHVPELGYGPGGAPITLEFKLTREELEQLIEPLVQRTFKVCADALALARVPQNAFDNVILVGGSTRIPKVRRAVEQYFGKKPLDRVNPDEVVAVGAAIQAAALTGAERRRTAQSQGATPVPPPRATPAYGQGLRDSVGADGRPRVPTLGGGTVRPGVIPGVTPRAPTAVPKITGRIVTTPISPDHTPSPSLTEIDDDPFALSGVRAPSYEVGDSESGGSHGGFQAPRVEEDLRPGLSRKTNPGLMDSVPRTTGRLVAPTLDAHSSFPDHSPEPVMLGRANQVPPPYRREPAHTPHGIGPAIVTPLAGEFPDIQPIVPTPTVRFDGQPPPRPAATQMAISPARESFPPLPPPNRGAQPAFPPQDLSAAPTPAWPQPEVSAGLVAPLLIDVTPLTLSIETVGGYIDRIIARNTSVPCAQTRTFTTSKDGQVAVLLRVCQGEADRFGGNTMLGELELSGLRAARRGEVSVEVTFELDADGMLQVRAVDVETQRQTAARMKLGA